MKYVMLNMFRNDSVTSDLSVDRRRGNQVKILNDPVTVNRESGKKTIVQQSMRRNVMTWICESGNLLVMRDEASEQGIASKKYK